MKHLHDKHRLTPDEWDVAYTDASRYVSGSGGVKERVADAMTLIGDVQGKAVLDVGGGPLLGRALIDAGAAHVTLVDICPRACELAREYAPEVDVVCMDASAYPLDGFDVIAAIGVIEYNPPEFAERLFHSLAPDLIVYTPRIDAYLDHPGRVTAFSEDDLLRMCRRRKRRMVNCVPSSEHVFANYRRLR